MWQYFAFILYIEPAQFRPTQKLSQSNSIRFFIEYFESSSVEMALEFSECSFLVL